MFCVIHFTVLYCIVFAVLLQTMGTIVGRRILDTTTPIGTQSQVLAVGKSTVLIIYFIYWDPTVGKKYRATLFESVQSTTVQYSTVLRDNTLSDESRLHSVSGRYDRTVWGHASYEVSWTGTTVRSEIKRGHRQEDRITSSFYRSKVRHQTHISSKETLYRVLGKWAAQQEGGDAHANFQPQNQLYCLVNVTSEVSSFGTTRNSTFF